MISIYQYQVNCRSIVEAYLPYKVNYHYSRYYLAWNLLRYLKELDGLPSEGQEDVKSIQNSLIIGIFIGTND
jgi:hypothetical protein